MSFQSNEFLLLNVVAPLYDFPLYFDLNSIVVHLGNLGNSK